MCEISHLACLTGHCVLCRKHNRLRCRMILGNALSQKQNCNVIFKSLWFEILVSVSSHNGNVKRVVVSNPPVKAAHRNDIIKSLQILITVMNAMCCRC